jgi:sulfonate transport system permease protein
MISIARSAASRVAPGVGLFLALLVWEAAAQATAGRFLIAGPSQIVLWLWANAGLVSRALGTTFSAASLGFVLGNIVAAGLAALAFLLPRSERLIGALALLVFCLPFVATGPILRVLYGPGPGPQITLAALAVYYTSYLALMTGLRAAPASWFDLVRSYGRGPAQALLRVRLRAAVPYAMAALQIAAPAAFLGAMVGEFTGADRGLGVLTIRSTRALDIPGTWAIATVAASVCILAYALFGLMARKLAVAPVATILAIPPTPATPPLGGTLHAIWRTVLVALVVLCLWYGLMQAFALNPFFAKRPHDVWAHLVTAPDAALHRATLAYAFGQTMILSVPGYLAGIALGAALAALVVLRPGISATALPLAIALRSVPIITTAPLIVLVIGRGAIGTITITAVMTFFPTFVACLNGLRQMPRPVRDVFASYAATRLQRLIHAQIPAMLPALFAAARMAVPTAILAATTTEWLATGIGMGTLMALSASTSAYGTLWSAVVILSVTAALAYAGVEAIELRVLRRYAPEQLSP